MQSANIVVSVIVPVYKVERYVEQCTRSLMEQTMKDGIEFIFVDDGSPDRSIEIIERIIDEYPERKGQVIILRQKNKGLPAARERGVTAASGKYIIHCDSDDWAEPEMYETLYKSAVTNDADIVICDFFSNGKRQIYISQKPDRLSSESVLASIAGSSKTVLHGGVWNKLVRNSLYKGLKYSIGINYCEDVYMQFQFFNKERKIAYVPKGLYHYRATSGSLVNSVPDGRVKECLELMKKIDVWRNNASNNHYRIACEAKIAGLMYYLCFEGMAQAKSSASQMLQYKDFLKSNHQISVEDHRYITNFLKGNYHLAFIQSKIARYRMIAKNLKKRYLK